METVQPNLFELKSCIKYKVLLSAVLWDRITPTMTGLTEEKIESFNSSALAHQCYTQLALDQLLLLYNKGESGRCLGEQRVKATVSQIFA